MNAQDKLLCVERYSARLGAYGYDSRSLCWGGGKERQHLRFSVLSEIGIGKTDSVLDVGCGFADLYGYLREQSWAGEYLGVDINPDLLTEARSQFPEAHCQVVDILEDNSLPQWDWVVASGIFNARLLHEDNWTFIQKMLTRMFELSRCGVASDFMSTYVDFQRPESFHVSPTDLLEFARQITPRLVLRLDYLPYEFAVYLKKGH